MTRYLRTAKKITQSKITRTPSKENMNIPNLPLYSSGDGITKIAIIQPASYGDNVNSTLMFKPLKWKYPKSVIDVYTASNYASAFVNNPYIDNLIQFPADTKEKALHLVHVIPPHVQGRGYDLVFNPHPMINPDKWTSIKHGELGTNLICAWVRALENADVDYNLPLETILRLTDDEVRNVDRYCAKVDMAGKRNVLMEVEGLSGQTFWNHEWTLRVGRHLLRGDTNLFISRRDHTQEIRVLAAEHPGCVHHADLTIRECAELFNRCDAFFSVSSGLSNACNTSWGRKDRRWVETVNSDSASSSTIRREGKTFWTDNNLDGFLNTLMGLGI